LNILPKDHYGAESSAEMQNDGHKQTLLGQAFVTQQVFGQFEVATAAHRKKFRQSLHHPEDGRK
jgi:hypothetical protein